jgi:hypothetical protein
LPETRYQDGLADERANVPQQLPASTLLRQRHKRFVFETALLLGFVLLIYFWLSYSFGTWKYRYGPGMFLIYLLREEIPSISLLFAIAAIFLVFVYYGTSFEVTPLQLVLRPFRSGPGRPSSGYSRGPDDAPPGLVESTEMRREEELVAAQESSNDLITGQPSSPSVAGDPQEAATVNNVLEYSSKAAAKLADKMERRINTHLILGVLVGLVGLGIWYYSFFIGGTAPDKTHSWTEMIPRVSILLFIELLAGFFLQQYRIGVEDLKYFLELERRANANRVAYAIFEKMDDDKARREFAKSLMQVPSDTRLHRGETTTSLEALKGQENVTLKAIGIIGDHLEAVTKLAHKTK